MKLKLNFKLAEQILFVVVLLISVFPVILNEYNATLDGPAHLYNIKLLNWYFSNPVIDQYYYINKTPSPNLFSQAFIAFFNLFVQTNISEKLFTLFYFIGFTLSLRYFIKAFNPKNVFVSILGIPLAHSYLFYIGFYNFSISFVFLFFGIAFYYQKLYKKENSKPLHYFILFLALAFTYFSNVLSYVYLLGVLSIYELNTLIYFSKNALKHRIANRILKNLLISLPSLTCLILFYATIDFEAGNHRYSVAELSNFLISFHSLIVNHQSSDFVYTSALFGVITLMIGFVLFKIIRSDKTSFFTKNFDELIFLCITLIVLLAYYRIYNNSGAGMMTDRLCNLFFVSLVLFIACQKQLDYPKLLIPLILIPHFFLFQIHRSNQSKFSTVASEVAASSQYIKENSVVLPVNFLHKEFFIWEHFPDYLGVNKPLIILDNYEAYLPWFPLNWDLQRIPKLTLNGKESIKGLSWPKSTHSSVKKEIDYVYILGNLNELNNPEFQDLKINLDSAYTCTYKDEKNKIFIFSHQ